MRFYVKRFEEFTTIELYEILKVRAEIFVVEQNCVYQDLDDVDFKSLHMYLEEDGKVQAYLRAFSREEEPGTVRIGRVLTRVHGLGHGGLLLKESLREIRERLHPERMYLEAQCYAVGYYEREGFRICTEEFLEDGIPHVGMELFETVFRHSRLEDVDQMVQIADDGKSLLKSKGINQWQRGTYPDRPLFTKDVADGIGYVLARGPEVLAICAVTFTDEASYRRLSDGAWMTADDAVYATIHRGAVAKKHQGQGLSGELFAAVSALAEKEGALSVRVDTHPDNLSMQGALEKAGFTKVSEFYILEGDEAGDLRYGYEKLTEAGKVKVAIGDGGVYATGDRVATGDGGRYSKLDLSRFEVMRATEGWQKAAAAYVRIEGMAMEHHIPQDVEFDEKDDDPDTKYIVLVDDVRPVATCRFYQKAPEEMSVGRVIVIPEYRGQMLGSRVIMEAEKWIRELGMKKITLESRDTAVAFYEKLGFTADYSRTTIDTFACVHMEKDLC